MSLEDLGQPFMVKLPPQQSATGHHELWSLFVESGRAAAPGSMGGSFAVVPFAGRKSSTAFLAFSEKFCA